MVSKKEQLKWIKDTSIDEYDLSRVVRYDKKELKNRVEFILNIGLCQVCDNSTNLDYPHHARFGNSRKDDRFLVCICVDCHRTIHNKGFKTLDKTREETEDIGWNNNLEYLDGTDQF